MEDQSQGGRSHLITNEPFHRSSSDPDRHLPSTLSTLPTKSGSRAASRTLPPRVPTRARSLSACVCLSVFLCVSLLLVVLSTLDDGSSVGFQTQLLAFAFSV